MIRFGEPCFHFQTVESTQTLAVDAARQGAVPGTAFTAANQTAGRGRRGRVWSAPPDANVNVSVVAGGIPPVDLWHLAPLTAVCILDALQSCFPTLEARLRFPNDVVCGKRKLAGVLIEAVHDGKVSVPVIGIGVNVRSAELPEDLKSTAGAIEDFVGSEVLGGDPVRWLTTELFQEFGKWWEILRSEGVEPIVDAWNRGMDPSGERHFVVGGTAFSARVGRLTADGRVELAPTSGGLLRVAVSEVVLGDI